MPTAQRGKDENGVVRDLGTNASTGNSAAAEKRGKHSPLGPCVNAERPSSTWKGG